jgi:enterochelin esterase-like enzyme
MSVVSPWFLAGCALAAAATWAAWAGWAAVRAAWTGRAGRAGPAAGVARGRRPRGLVAVAVLLTLATVASGVNAYFGYLPGTGDLANVVDGQADWPALPAAAATPAATAAAATAAVRTAPAGRVVRLWVPDGGTGVGAGWVPVYLPPQYATEPGRRFPVLYLFHGSPGVPADWFRGGRAAAAAAALAAAGRPVIVVAPRMSRGWLDDPECVDGVTERVQRHFVRDVVPTVDARLRTIATRSGRVVGGMSAGGYCALNLGLRERGLVSGIIDLSGEVAPSHRGGLGAVLGTGPGARAAALANSPSWYARSLPAAPTTRVWFDCGSADRSLLPGIRSVAATLAGRGFPVRLTVRPGAHTFRVWRPALRSAMDWIEPPAPS